MRLIKKFMLPALAFVAGMIFGDTDAGRKLLFKLTMGKMGAE